MSELQYHVKLRKGDIGKYVILPGDPGRTDLIASYLEDAKLIAFNREYKTWTGTLNGEKVSVTSTGIGGPSAAIAIEELVACGAETFIRVGTCGGMQLDVLPGDLIIANGAIRKEGLTKEYTPVEYPAVPTFSVLQKMVQVAENKKLRHHVGVVECKDSYYGQHSPETKPVKNELLDKWDAWVATGAVGSEMESATLFIVSACLRVKCGTVLLVMSNQERRKAGIDEEVVSDMSSAIEVAVDAIKLIIKAERNQQ